MMYYKLKLNLINDKKTVLSFIAGIKILKL